MNPIKVLAVCFAAVWIAIFVWIGVVIYKVHTSPGVHIPPLFGTEEKQ